jgi:hypothetical protein
MPISPFGIPTTGSDVRFSQSLTAGGEVVKDYGHVGLTRRAHPLTFLRGDLRRRRMSPAPRRWVRGTGSGWRPLDLCRSLPTSSFGRRCMRGRAGSSWGRAWWRRRAASNVRAVNTNLVAARPRRDAPSPPGSEPSPLPAPAVLHDRQQAPVTVTAMGSQRDPTSDQFRQAVPCATSSGNLSGAKSVHLGAPRPSARPRQIQTCELKSRG